MQLAAKKFLLMITACAAMACVVCAEGAATNAVPSASERYCADVVAPALAGVFSSWTVRGPNPEILAEVCTNVDWCIVRKRHSRHKAVWIGGDEASQNNTQWRLGVIREKGGSFAIDARLWPFEADPSTVTNTCATNAHVRIVGRPADRTDVLAPIEEAKRLVVEARKLRLQGKGPAASKTLRAADANDPLCVWSKVERIFLEEGGEGAVDAAREGRAHPEVSVSQCRDAYLKIGATNEVRLIDQQLKKTGDK